jgi:hypothetical protein
MLLAMFQKLGKPNPKDASYRGRYLTLAKYLEKVPAVSHDLVHGDLSPTELGAREVEDLAPDPLKKAREGWVDLAISNAEALLDEVKFTPSPSVLLYFVPSCSLLCRFLFIQGTKTTDYVCPRCEQRDCDFIQKQTRSLEEPITTYVHCLKCDHRWLI